MQNWEKLDKDLSMDKSLARDSFFYFIFLTRLQIASPRRCSVSRLSALSSVGDVDFRGVPIHGWDEYNSDPRLSLDLTPLLVLRRRKTSHRDKGFVHPFQEKTKIFYID